MKLTLKDGQVLTLRPATNADCKRVASHVHEVLREYGLPVEPGGADFCLNDLERSYGSGVFEVVEDAAGAIVGCYGLLNEGGGTCELRKMYLQRRVRGQGLGKQLLQRALARAKEAGFRRVELTTAAPLKEAVGLYESFGFAPCNKEMPDRCDRALALTL